MKKIVLIIFALVSSIFFATTLVFLLKSNKLNLSLSQSQEIIQKIQEENKRLEEEKVKINTAKDKLEANAVSYLALNTKLQKETDSLNDKLKKAQRLLGNKEADLQRLTDRLEQVQAKMTKENTSQNEKLAKQKKELQNKLIALETRLKKEKAQYFYNLGVAYAKAELYDEAVEAYEKSLALQDNNPDAHYNLGLIYDSYRQDPDNAILHFQKYLELRPDADDKDEVLDWIDRLKQ